MSVRKKESQSPSFMQLFNILCLLMSTEIKKFTVTGPVVHIDFVLAFSLIPALMVGDGGGLTAFNCNNAKNKNYLH